MLKITSADVQKEVQLFVSRTRDEQSFVHFSSYTGLIVYSISHRIKFGVNKKVFEKAFLLFVILRGGLQSIVALLHYSRKSI